MTEIFYNTRQQGCGLALLDSLGPECAKVVFFDPQYRGVLDRLSYGNEGARQKGRANLKQMPEEMITSFLKKVDRVLLPDGYLFLWVDKFHLCNGVDKWFEGLSLGVVDLITWDKGRMGMGYRTRRQSEHLMIFQKPPQRAKATWKKHNIPDVWSERFSSRKGHPHKKPLGLQTALVEATTVAGDLVVDPAAGSFSVLEAVLSFGDRRFCGTDLEDHGEQFFETVDNKQKK